MIHAGSKRALELWRGYRPPNEGRPVRSLSEIVPSALARLGLEDRFRQSTLRDGWRHVMGDFVAEHTRPAGIYRHVLTVEVDHSTWLQEMTLFHKRVMLENLRRQFPDLKIKDIKFRLQG